MKLLGDAKNRELLHLELNQLHTAKIRRQLVLGGAVLGERSLPFLISPQLTERSQIEIQILRPESELLSDLTDLLL